MADPTAIAGSFLEAFKGLCATGNVAGLTGLYGPESVAIYDGSLQKGAAGIAASFVAPRLPGGVGIKFSSQDAHFTPTGHLIIMVTGEATKPAARFSQVFVLQPLPAGGMYIKVDICRFSAGAAPQVLADTTTMAAAFVQQYYTQYHKDKAGLAAVFGPKSQLSFEGKLHQGAPAIAAALPGLPTGEHAMGSLDTVTLLDAPPAPGAVGPAAIAFVTGMIRLEGERNPLAFAEAFLVAAEGPAMYCGNSLFRFNYA